MTYFTITPGQGFIAVKQIHNQYPHELSTTGLLGEVLPQPSSKYKAGDLITFPPEAIRGVVYVHSTVEKSYTLIQEDLILAKIDYVSTI